jgi:hypothetical protein
LGGAVMISAMVTPMRHEKTGNLFEPAEGSTPLHARPSVRRF